MASDGPAGGEKNESMGVYLKDDSQLYNYRPVYILDSLQRSGQFLYYNDDGFWTMAPTIGGGVAIVSIQQGLLTPPATGWEYFDFDFKEDPYLTVTESSESCLC